MTAVFDFLAAPPVWVDVFGYTLVALVALEVIVGRKRMDIAGRGFRRSHLIVAWAMASIMGVHALIGIGHALTDLFGPAAAIAVAGGHVHVEAGLGNLPLWLDINGVLIVFLFTVQALSGYRKFHLTRPQFLSLHSAASWLIALAAGVHAVLATLHLVLG